VRLDRQPEVGRLQPHGPQRAAGHRERGGVRVVERLDQHDLVARLDEPEHGGGDGLGASGRHRDLALGVDLETMVERETLGDGALHELGTIEVGEALPQIHRLVLHRQSADAGENALAKSGEPGRRAVLR